MTTPTPTTEDWEMDLEIRFGYIGNQHGQDISQDIADFIRQQLAKAEKKG